MGMINYLGKFIPNMSSINKPFRQLLEKDVSWEWGEAQKSCFDELKSVTTSTPVLGYYDVSKPVKLTVDASSHGLGACILQDEHPVCYASRALNKSEQNYAQIEKEMIAIVYGATKFHQYIYGKRVLVETDHKPLESLFKKPLYSAPPRIQHMLKLQRYDLDVHYKPGTLMFIPDTLSRAHGSNTDFDELKSVTTSTPVLGYYDVSKPVKLTVDASSHGLGACILQDEHPVCYASRALNKSEQNYAQIEKEMIAIVYGATKFHQYIYGKRVLVETDHKPLESLFKKPLYSAPPRIQHMLKLQRYDLDVHYKPGTLMFIPDTLSRAHGSNTDFDELKSVTTSTPVLGYYDVSKPVKLTVDASSHGLGACILQDEHPVCYASRALNKSEQNYAQIEKEMIAIVYGATKFHQYIYGKRVLVETDHKPLESLFKKPLYSAPPRIQHMLKLQRYDLDVHYKPGTLMFIPDTLSRAHGSNTDFDELKSVTTSTPVLGYYDVSKPVKLTVDASSHGLGACILQDEHPVCYASRALNKSEQNYAQIEKEMIAIVYGATKFHQYIYGKRVLVETDHKPLESLFKKPLYSAPPRIQHMLKLQRYDLDVHYKPGTLMFIPDTLSRAHGSNTDFDELKSVTTSTPVLGYYDVSKPVKLTVDASSHGLGACILQDEHPVCYASRALNKSEQNYAQIEKEMIAIVYGATKFHQYIYGKRVLVETDHKPLESLFKKPLYSAPPRIQHMLKLQRYDLDVHYKPGTLMFIPDTLSRAHGSNTDFDELKSVTTSTPVLGYYDVSKPVKLTVDASSHGLGACILQDEHPVCYASRALNKSEQNYAQIEKEMIAIVYGATKFHQYIYGKRVLVETDHKPLESLFKKPLYSAPPRIQHMLKLQRYDLDVHYKPGTLMFIPDTLSRAHGSNTDCDEMEFEVHTIENLPVSKDRLSEMKLDTQNDETLQKLKNVVLHGWPEMSSEIDIQIKPYWNIREQIIYIDELLLKGDCIIVPECMRKEKLKQIHRSHLGIEKCLRRAREILYWPSMNCQIRDIVSQCGVCCRYRNKPQKEPLHSHEIPDPGKWLHRICSNWIVKITS
ncbi:uncharacterized protein LOC121372300 [Gigantopelta aegis]|uniref:uncharacterized protein LOC121372300 n=1 Tax=Gigantopelta aegis TaxID=1735272 RepID=UPI001B8892E8|nr:uncharacterized protein LOC121372300 [Gigantopelta aegis]